MAIFLRGVGSDRLKAVRLESIAAITLQYVAASPDEPRDLVISVEYGGSAAALIAEVRGTSAAEAMRSVLCKQIGVQHGFGGVFTLAEFLDRVGSR